MPHFHIIIDKERCKGCELCVSVCPKKLLAMAPNINSKGYHYPVINSEAECIGCLQCAIVCPDAVIEIERYEDEKQKK